MKVTLQNDYRKYYTVEDIHHAKAVIAYEKDDEMKLTEWAEYAINEALRNEKREQVDYLRNVIQAEAHTARNCRAWQLYGEETGDMDVWVEATAKTANGFIEVGAYLSDIWQTGAIPYKQHMYIQYYKRAEL